MGFKQGFFQWAGRMMFERPVRSQSVVDIASTLSSSGDEVRERIAGKEGTPANVARLRHIIGIERWGQQRLRVFLGDPFEPGGHHPHKPTDTDWRASRRSSPPRARTRWPSPPSSPPQTSPAPYRTTSSARSRCAAGWRTCSATLGWSRS
ncbi:MAG TPA: hypothetical protein VF710_23010 [Longimicrobium sp.]